METGAGEGSGLSDEAYARAGALIARSAAEAWSADMVVKVKEPLPAEYGHFRLGSSSIPTCTWPPSRISPGSSPSEA